MRRIFYIAALLAVAGYAAAQDIRITRFERCFTCIGASMNPVYDNTGKACALIRFAVRDTSMVIEPNNGYVKREALLGEIRLYVPVTTRRLTLRAAGLKPLRDYEIPERLESKVTYDADVETVTISRMEETVKENEPIEMTVGEKQEIVKDSRVKSRDNNIYPYIAPGWNVLPLNGPELALGVDINHHVIELSGVYGLKKTEPLFYYSAQTTDERPIAAWQYADIRGSLSYGYDMMLKSAPVSAVPMIGVTGSYFRGINYMGIQTGEYKKASSMSAFAALRLKWSPTKHVGLYVTPRYDLNVYRSNTCKLISFYDGKLKGWTKGLNLSAGVMLSF